jgi:hypothetical protein
MFRRCVPFSLYDIGLAFWFYRIRAVLLAYSNGAKRGGYKAGINTIIVSEFVIEFKSAHMHVSAYLVS